MLELMLYVIPHPIAILNNGKTSQISYTEPEAQEQKLHQTEILMNIFMEMLLSQLIQIMEQ